METPIVYNIKTDSFVAFRLEKNGEIRIVSTHPSDTEEDCIVTTWNNIADVNRKKYLSERAKLINGKKI